MPQLRQNIITGEWVVIAPERAKRPSDFVSGESLKADTGKPCPFCLGGPAYKQVLRDYESEDFYTIPNAFPAFLEDPTSCSHRTYHVEDDFYSARPSTGGHDVIVSKHHDEQLFDFRQSTWEAMLLMAKRRYIYWRHDCNTSYAMLIYNQGARAGASIFHPHAQLMASNIIPNQVSREIHGAQSYFEQNGSCVFCDLVTHEIKEKARVVAATDNFIAFTFYAARFPFETWVMPKGHSACFETQSATQLRELAGLMKDVIGKLGLTLKRPSLNFYIHDLPSTVENADYYHWHIEITPRVTHYGGYELGSGVIIDVMSPEVAAKYLKKG
ncbi:galactose-1-phosphate uridylyltransferase [Candidatus Berkelbacteria bacterium RIFCSPLOWO2_01_FULL_50_28]|uniref:Galactose-1-phosphate uridylyltransferase n=1 Tax=Candidatus Berkelbacteria bacterium RIFCSPLOWO2_01_FULL_50_28 TaxID=1797471 RepID=A0A1F5ED06_9BACT|nr:MAG: galactose-1-phosphate uridylyltransferase [Candidatus Berkelbacteria bacterium RIFCSPHIGHO2_01_FULL_50_36]OGD63507.1 MAG: galactose-1-phosphate uridylyltransferase [Candidatus Berkelbacteria bacterium RIFCSPHIGHO2_12_FULL_50_11]OGD65136.1 MAG: galactose-1-phosphate uridylyltransferase [Candidatus Berkelbacteria bacterium RIFCSPLOWO2_01_FULL_50_28]